MARGDLLPFAELATSGRLTSILETYLADGLSTRRIAYQLRIDHGISVSRETVRRWIARLGLDGEVAS